MPIYDGYESATAVNWLLFVFCPSAVEGRLKHSPILQAKNYFLQYIAILAVSLAHIFCGFPKPFIILCPNNYPRRGLLFRS